MYGNGTTDLTFKAALERERKGFAKYSTKRNQVPLEIQDRLYIP